MWNKVKKKKQESQLLHSGILFNLEMKLQATEQNNLETTKPGFIPHPLFTLK